MHDPAERRYVLGRRRRAGAVVHRGGGENHEYTQRTTRWTAHNLVHMARILRANPIPAEGNTREGHEEHHLHAG